MRGNLFAGLDGLDGAEWLRAVVGRYLSRTHRDMPASGCPLPSLSSEIAREDGAPREELEHYLKTMVAELATRTPDAPGLSSEDRVLATVALLVGALTLSRAVPDPGCRTASCARRAGWPFQKPRRPRPPSMRRGPRKGANDERRATRRHLASDRVHLVLAQLRTRSAY
ncbi:MAG: hypothetical protein M5R36_26805 [Deltaproteobacteria bacterium]|nr:hypothetical protein [Deltaproteobacteria bacterium]